VTNSVLQQDQKPYGCVYKITNLVNGKVYVGQTTRGINHRWGQHKSLSKNPKKESLLQKAIHKYGEENFKVEEVDAAGNLDELNFKEEVWIEKCRSLNPCGYNIREGGSCSPFSEDTKKKLSESAKIQMSNPKYRELI
jgi:group I intron endonuclease